MVADESPTSNTSNPRHPDEDHETRVAVRFKSAFKPAGGRHGEELLVAGFGSKMNARQWAKVATEGDFIFEEWETVLI